MFNEFLDLMPRILIKINQLNYMTVLFEFLDACEYFIFTHV